MEDELQGVREVPETVWKIWFASFSGREGPELLSETSSLSHCTASLSRTRDILSHRTSSLLPWLDAIPLIFPPPPPELKAQPFFMLTWFLFTYTQVPGNPRCLLPSSIPHGQFPCLLLPRALCWGSSCTTGAENLSVPETTLLPSDSLSCCFHAFTSQFFPQVPG